MKKLIFFITASFLFISLILNTYLNKSIQQLSDVEKCPFCYGMDYCDSNATLKKDSVRAIFNNLLSTKNVMYTDNFVLKKLASDFELEEFDKDCDLDGFIGAKEVLDYLNFVDEYSVRNFRICSGVDEFFHYLIGLKKSDADFDDYYKNLWTILHINVEPLILQILKAEEGWPVPIYYGSCGRLIFQQNCGNNLNNFKSYAFLDRVYLAVQIIEAAFNFTESHKDFRYYLTDVSPDNIAVNQDLKVTFIDLENVIITRKNGGSKTHSSELFGNEIYAYSEKEICDSSISDHNYFTICKLLLSWNAPWPMMEKGLLNSIPNYIQTEHPDIHETIENCVHPQNGNNRFNITQVLLSELKGILHQHNYLD